MEIEMSFIRQAVGIHEAGSVTADATPSRRAPDSSSFGFLHASAATGPPHLLHSVDRCRVFSALAVEHQARMVELIACPPGATANRCGQAAAM
jgi:hypothetical protein